MNLPAASGRGIVMDYLDYFLPQAAGNLPKEIKYVCCFLFKSSEINSYFNTIKKNAALRYAFYD